MTIEQLSAYQLEEKREIADLKSVGYRLRHKKSGARVVLLSNEDENKVFSIGFRTPPKDSTGVAHILEHSVLCGSKNFPVKDPFVELVKGSLNTFLNAMTYPDKTIYPVASCNDKDFQNLMHVYMDAVLYPNIYQEKKIFEQEGWHYHLESKEEELAINGVVYSEMKGAFSSPDDMFEREVFDSLFPDTPYGVESGGHPDFIPDLTYEDFLAFHKTYYHPANSYIYLYGNMDMVEKLAWMDETYLSQFDKIDLNSAIPKQEKFDKPNEASKQYAVTEEETEADGTYLSYNAVVGTSLDQEEYIAFQILDYALCLAPGAPLKEALIKKGIGKEVYSVYESVICQPYFSIVAKGANETQRQAFLDTIKSVLMEQVEKGMDEKSLLAGLNYYEFKYREADFGRYPKGLMYGMQMLDSWLYDDTKPFLHIEANQTFQLLRDRIKDGYYEGLIKRCLLENTHRSTVVLSPKKGLTAAKEKERKEILKAYRDSLTDQEIDQVVAHTQELLAYQEEEDTPENVAKIPFLTRKDMKRTAESFVNVEKKVGDITLLHHDVFTNGIDYIKLLFSMDSLPEHLLPYASVLQSVLGFIGTKNYAYGALFNEIYLQTGGMSNTINTYVNAQNSAEFKTTFEIKTKVMEAKKATAFALIEEILRTSDFSDTERLYEIIAELKSRMQASMGSEGHNVSALRAMAGFSKTAVLAERISGIEYYRFLEDLEANFEQKKAILVENLNETLKHLMRKENLLADFTGCKEEATEIEVLLQEFQQKLYTEEVKTGSFNLATELKKEAYYTSSQVQYVCAAGNFQKKNLPYTGALRALKVLLGYDYLWNQIRVKGGAYGCMCAFGKTGDAYLVSYRDPNLEKTFQTYRGAAEFVRTYEGDETEITKLIIGAISTLDTPLSPSAKGSRSLAAYLSKVSFEEIQKEREEVLEMSLSDLQALAPYLDALMEEGCICVVGNEEKIRNNKELFTNIEPLFH